jgi:hypothetical protein
MFKKPFHILQFYLSSGGSYPTPSILIIRIAIDIVPCPPYAASSAHLPSAADRQCICYSARNRLIATSIAQFVSTTRHSRSSAKTNRP